MKKPISFLICICILLLLSSCSDASLGSHSDYTPVVHNKQIVSYSGSLQEITAPEGMELICETGFTALYFNQKTTDFAVADRRSGQFWYSSPPDARDDTVAQGVAVTSLSSSLVITDILPEDGIEMIRNTSYGSVGKNTFKARTRKNGFDVLYTFDDPGYSVPLSVTLEPDGLSVEVDTSKITEKTVNRIYRIQILPNFGAQPETEDGFLLMPDGCGSLINFKSKRTQYAYYSAAIYGEDYIASPDYTMGHRESCLLPVVGICASGKSMLAIAEQGAACATANGSPSGLTSSYSSAGFTFNVRSQQNCLIGNIDAWNTREVIVFEEAPLKSEVLKVRYLLPSEEDSNLGGFASVFREYMLGSDMAKPDTTEEAPLYLTALGADMVKRSILGIRVDSVLPATTFRDASEITKELKQDGIKQIKLIYEGYDSNAISGKIQTSVSPIGKLGGKKALNELLDELGQGNLYLTADINRYTKSGAGYSLTRSSAKDMNHSPITIKNYKRSTFFPNKTILSDRLLNIDSVAELIEKLSDRINAGYKGVGVMLSDASNMLYSDFINSTEVIRRTQAEYAMSNAINKASSNIKLMGDGAAYYAFSGLSSLVNTPSESASYDVVDSSVPFYQMVMHGVMPVVSRPVNRSGSPDTEFLKVVSMGMIPHYEITKENTGKLSEAQRGDYYGSGYDSIKKTILEQYEKFKPVFDATAKLFMTDYIEIVPNVYKTVYSDGSYTLINIGEDTQAGGYDIASKEIILVTGGEQ